MKWHRALVLFTGLLATLPAYADLASLFTNAQRTAAVPRRPSIIVIQCRDLAYGDLSINGQTHFQTPNLDRLAADGVRFSGYTGSGSSAANTAALLAGKAVSDPGVTNLAQILHQSGYRTGFIGEWTYDRQPWLRGFDEFAGFFSDEEARDYYAPAVWRYPRISYDESNRVQSVTLDHEPLYPNSGGKKGQYLPELFVRAMNNFIQIAKPDTFNRWRPFFLVVNMPAPRSAAINQDDFPVPSDAPFTDEPWPPAARNRAALLTRLDGGIGRLFEQLEKTGLTNNIAIFFASSSAPEKFATPQLNSFFGPNDLRSTNNPSPHLPLIVRYPAKMPGGQVSELRLAPEDIAPTILEISHSKPEPSFTGISIFPLLQGKRGTNVIDIPKRIVPSGSFGR